MDTHEIRAKSDNLDRITQLEKEGIDDYIENVKNAIKIIEYQIKNYAASGDKLDRIKDNLWNDVNELKEDIKKLSKLSEQLNEKIADYKNFLNLLSEIE